MKEPNPHNLIVRYPVHLTAALFPVMLVSLLVHRTFQDNLQGALILAILLSLSGGGILLAWAHRPLFLYVTLAIMLGAPLPLLGLFQILPFDLPWLGMNMVAQRLLSALPIVLPLWGYAVHILYIINKRRREKAEQQ